MPFGQRKADDEPRCLRGGRQFPRAGRAASFPSRFELPGGGARAGAYIPFGLGPRVCTGATIAQLEASLILCEVLRRHDVQIVEPERVFPGSRVTIRPVRRMQCRLSPA